MPRLPFLDPDPPSFGEFLALLIIVCVLFGFVLGLFTAALLIGGA